MIIFDKALCKEIRDFSLANTPTREAAGSLALDIMETLWGIEKEDMKNGTNELGALLEKSISSIANEYGLVDDELTHEQGLRSL